MGLSHFTCNRCCLCALMGTITTQLLHRDCSLKENFLFHVREYNNANGIRGKLFSKIGAIHCLCPDAEKKRSCSVWRYYLSWHSWEKKGIQTSILIYWYILVQESYFLWRNHSSITATLIWIVFYYKVKNLREVVFAKIENII